MNSSLSVDLSGCWLDEHGITKLQFAELANRLETVRDETVLTDVKLLQSESIPVEKVPLDGRFYELPERLLRQYAEDRRGSELAQILSVARQLQDSS
ncbi:glucose-6-phosphate isomerase, partial [Pirellulaceae bacterium]|nr:glucose-6-phosphate isomerase [Pirellulaceae bacterium]